MKTNRIILVLLALLSISCQKKEVVSLYQKQAKNISSFVTKVLKDSTDSYATYNEGVTRITLLEGGGPVLKEGDTLSFTFAAYTFGTGIQSSNLVDTNDSTWAKAAGWTRDVSELQSFRLPFTKAYFLEGLLLGLDEVQEGERCTVLFTGEHGFGERPVGIVGSYAAMAYRIRVNGISKK